MAEQTREPSVEEILASIKKVIAQDGRAAALTGRKAAPFPYGASDDESTKGSEEILELTESDTLPEEGKSEEGAVGDRTTESEPQSEADMLAADKQKAMRESLAALASLSEPSAAPQVVRSGETSLEGMARDMLRPMLAEWLNENLPDLVEQLVTKEISRITRKD